MLKSTNVICAHCSSTNIKKNGVKSTGKQTFYCKSCNKQFQSTYQYQGASPVVKKLICTMSMRASGIRDISKVLNVSAVTVISTLRKWFKLHQEPDFEGIFEEVIIDEMWSWVGKRKEAKRWIWYAQCAKTGSILAFQIVNVMTKRVKS